MLASRVLLLSGRAYEVPAEMMNLTIGDRPRPKKEDRTPPLGPQKSPPLGPEKSPNLGPDGSPQLAPLPGTETPPEHALDS